MTDHNDIDTFGLVRSDLLSVEEYLVVRQSSIDWFSRLFVSPLDPERTAICQKQRDGYSARILQIRTI